MTEGSPDVDIGNYAGRDKTGKWSPAFILKDMPGPLGAPLMNTPWKLALGWRVLESGTTDEEGRVAIKTMLSPGILYDLHYTGRTIALLSYTTSIAASSLKGIRARLALLGYHPGALTDQPHVALNAALAQFRRDYDVAEGERSDDGPTLAKLQEIAGF